MRRKLFVLVLLIASAGLTLESCVTPQIPGSFGNLSQFGSLMIELETSVLFDYQTPQWRTRRSGWISNVRTAYTLGRMKELLIEFETNVNYSAQISTWPSRRNGWLAGVQRAATLNQLANLMIECETSINYNAQSQGWRNARSRWLSRTRALY